MEIQDLRTATAIDVHAFSPVSPDFLDSPNSPDSPATANSLKSPRVPDSSVLPDSQGAANSPDSRRVLWLACLPWEGERPLAGHSDADAAAHAAADALLIAAGVGELGSVFGTDKPEWAGASGASLLGEAVRLVREAGWKIANISVQIIGEKPRFAPRKAEAEAAMTAVVGAPVSVAATSTDKLGTLGRQEGIAAIATALIWK
ncbi:2-C-methyl-D-erythritol 2,4-cyclodiphosphate synthase [Arcanobacterium hippocoleae]